MVAFFPLGQSLALEPMGDIAGTAAAVLGFTMALFGAGLAALIDQAISGTVTPVGIGYLAYGTAGMACQLFAVRHSRAPSGRWHSGEVAVGQEAAVDDDGLAGDGRGLI